MKQFSPRLIFSAALLVLTVTFQFTGCSSDKDPDEGPHIEKLTPNTGSIGTEVVISGKTLYQGGGGVVVKFNGVEAEITYIDQDSAITVIAPNGGSTGPVTITSGTQELTGPDFTYAGEPTPKSKYYVKFKAGDSWLMYQTGEPGYSTCGQCSCSAVPPQLFSDTDNASIEICNEENHDFVTAAQIEALKNKTLSFNTGFPHPKFFYDFNEIDYGTEEAEQVSGSTMTITDVVAEPPYGGFVPAYKIVGTFSCKVVDDDGNTVEITEGKFAVRFTEDF